jgi:hypothetical protein
MRATIIAFVIGCALFAAGCSRPHPPEGRWEGVYESADTLVAARVEIGTDGRVKVSAPDLLGVETANEEARMGMRERLAGELAAAWDEVVPRKMDFDGATFRKPGGVAPQMEWDDKHHKMTLVAYFGARQALRIPLRGVSDFSDDPFNP